MPININPSDPGLEQAYQVQSGMVGNDPLSMILKAVQQTPQAVSQMRRRQGLNQFVQTGEVPGNMPIGSPMEAFLLARAKSLSAPDQAIDPDFASSIQKQTNAPSPPSTMREAMAMIQASKANKTQMTMGLRTDQFEQNQWNAINKVANPANASSRSLLGMAGQANLRASRAMKTLNDTQVTPQQINLAVTDLASIMQNGAADDFSIKQARFGNVMNDLMNLKTRLLSTPSAANQPEVVAKVKQIIGDVIQADNEVINDNLSTVESGVGNWMKTNRPDKWSDFKNKILVPIQRTSQQYTRTPDTTQQNMVPMFDPTGKPKLVPMENVGKAIEAKWKTRNGQ